MSVVTKDMLLTIVEEKSRRSAKFRELLEEMGAGETSSGAALILALATLENCLRDYSRELV